MYWILGDKKHVTQASNDFDKEILIGIRTLEGGLVSVKVGDLENAEEYTPKIYKRQFNS
jgi:hypothetical protein